MLTRLGRILGRGRPVAKANVDVRLEPPPYRDRHRGASILVLANGPSLNTHGEAVKRLIEMHHPVTLGANNISGFMHPSYHAFTNRKRFGSYGHTIDPKRSRALFSPYMPETLIRRHYRGPYEEIMYVADNDRPFGIEGGIITAGCRTVSTLLIGVALVMGADRVLVAGMDGYQGYLKSGMHTHHYGAEKDHGRSSEAAAQEAYLLNVERYNARFLDEIAAYMRAHGMEPFAIVTPTVHLSHYRPVEDFF